LSQWDFSPTGVDKVEHLFENIRLSVIDQHWVRFGWLVVYHCCEYGTSGGQNGNVASDFLAILKQKLDVAVGLIYVNVRQLFDIKLDVNLNANPTIDGGSDFYLATITREFFKPKFLSFFVMNPNSARFTVIIGNRIFTSTLRQTNL
jgi:hypothetical protein